MWSSSMKRGKLQVSWEVVNFILFGRLTRSKDKSLNLLLTGGTCSGCHTLTPFMYLESPLSLSAPRLIPAHLPLAIMLFHGLSLSHCRKCKLLWLFWTMTRLARTMPSGKSLWATTAPERSCGIGQTCWPTLGGPLHSGTPYSLRRR